MFKKRHIERYILGALIPYAILSLVLLTFILLAQQFSRFAELLGSARAPLLLAVEVTSHLLPSVLIFTLPMAILVGTATGFCRLGSDSELTAMRAAGVGNWRIISPVLVLGVLVSLLAIYVAFDVAPRSASALRDAAIRAALQKLDSPVDPRSFYTELPGKVIYVRDGDQETGQWGRVFIHWQEENGQLRLVTAKSGRIDTSGEQTELVLTDAKITTFPPGGGDTLAAGGSVTTEHSAHLRLRDDRLSAGRISLLKRLREREAEPDEMNWRQLRERARTAESTAQRLAAETALHKRLSLCLAPLALALLGAGMGLRVRRGGRAFGVALSLFAMLLYYLISLAGEQLARGGAVPPAYALWTPFVLTLISGLFLLYGRKLTPSLSLRPIMPSPHATKEEISKIRGQRSGVSLIRGLLDKSILSDLARNFAGTFIVLNMIFLLFTLFELLRFIVINSSSSRLVFKYLLFLLPLVSVTVAPMSMLLTVLITYSVLVRRSEIIAWWGSGQSIYRIVLPALLFSLMISTGFWFLQERVMPEANKRQNQLRTQIRSGVTRLEVTDGRQWLATEKTSRLFSYAFGVDGALLKAPVVYEFDDDRVHLKRTLWSNSASWSGAGDGLSLTFQHALVVDFSEGRVLSRRLPSVSVAGETADMFKPTLNNPAEMSSKELSAYIAVLKTRNLVPAALVVALERKRAALFDPLVMVLVGAPASLAFGRRSTVVALCAAVVLGLCFWGTVSLFGHLGGEGFLPAQVAVWVPTFIYAVTGVYLLLRVQT